MGTSQRKHNIQKWEGTVNDTKRRNEGIGWQETLIVISLCPLSGHCCFSGWLFRITLLGIYHSNSYVASTMTSWNLLHSRHHSKHFPWSYFCYPLPIISQGWHWPHIRDTANEAQRLITTPSPETWEWQTGSCLHSPPSSLTFYF